MYNYPMQFHLNKTLPRAKHIGVVLLVKGKNATVSTRAGGQPQLCIGIEKRNAVTQRKLLLIVRQIITLAKSQGIKRVALHLNDFSFRQLHIPRRELVEIIAVNLEMANFEFVRYKTPPPEGWKTVAEVTIAGDVSPDAREGVERGQWIAEAVNACRELANTPGGEMTPRLLAEGAKEAARGTKVSVKILGEAEMRRLKMGGVLGVAQGSTEEPRFIVMEYRGGGASEKPIVLVGKGITFDTGGLNLKPEGSIYEMHMDMSGGAAVIQAIVLAARLGVKKNVVALVPAVENMPSGSSYRPGDVLRSMSGKTIEVLNTDAEGRIVLADALTYAERYKPRLVVDVATLTGAAMAALGQRASAIFSKDEKLLRNVQRWGEETGEYVWPMPLWDEYAEEIKGTFGDVANIGKTRYGGAITAALFLYEFAKNYPWLHIDIAPRMTSVEGEHLAKGAAGAPVRLLIRLLEEY